MSSFSNTLQDTAFLNAYPELYTNYKLRGEQTIQLRKEALEKNEEEARVEMTRKNEENIDAAFFKVFPMHHGLNRKRDEILEKIKGDLERVKDDEALIRELLLSEPILSIWMRVSPNNENTVLWINNRWVEVHKWDPTNERTTVQKMLEGYARIQWFRTVCVHHIQDAIKKAMLPLWNETDEKILERDAVQKSGRGTGWSGFHAHIKDPLATTHIICKDWWKTNIQDEVGKGIYGVTLNNGQDLIVDEIGIPLYNEELTKWLFFCRKIVERSKGKSRLLEEKIESLTKRNEILEAKLHQIKIFSQC